MYRYMCVHMHDIYVTRMRTSEGITSEFLIIISLHQELALSLYLFTGYEWTYWIDLGWSLVVPKKINYVYLFIDDLISVDKTRWGVNANLEI